MSALAVRAGVEGLAAQAEALPSGAVPGWLAERRAEALSAFVSLGFPRSDDEQWRYTNVNPIASTPFQLAGAPEAPPRFTAWAARAEAPRLVFVNGSFHAASSDLSGLPEGVRVGSLAALLRDEPGLLEPHLARYAGHSKHAFAALNAAFLVDGACILVGKGVVVERPISVLHVLAPDGVPVMAQARTLVVLSERSQASVIESYGGAAAPASGAARNLVNAVTEIGLARGAVLQHVKLQEEAPSTFHVANAISHQASQSQLFSHVFSFGAALARNELTTALHGEGAGCELNGLYTVSGRQHVDNHTLIDHARPHTTSNELYKGILDGSSRGIFDGRIVVRPEAPKTDAHQTNKNLLLSDEALVDSKPQLEIFNNDVRCTHGSTTGRLDPDAFFYLRSRGIDPAAARTLLMLAFASELTGRVSAPVLAAYLEERILASVSGARGDA